MRKILILIALMLTVSAGMFSKAQSPEVTEAVAPQDSTVDVIAWLSKNDTIEYLVQVSSWKIMPDDTIPTGNVSETVRLVVTDSTSTGYKMEFTPLDFMTDQTDSTMQGRFTNAMVEKLGKKIAGTTVRFETDECGRITEITNLKEIKRKAISLYKESVRELLSLDEVKEMKKAGLDFSNILKDVNSDELVESYLEELKLIFIYNGLSMKIGETSEHEYATDSTYQNDSYIEVSFDPEDGSYSIVSQVDNIIPKDELRTLVGDFVDEVAKGVENKPDDLGTYINKAIDTNAIYTSYLEAQYLPVGIPYRIVKQTTSTLRDRGKCEQTIIQLTDYR